MNPSRGYTIEARDQTYGEIQEYLEIVRQYPDIYEEQPTIVIYNATGEAYLDEDYSVDLENDNPLIKVHSANQYLDNTSGDYSGITIYDFTENNDNPATSEFLKRFFQVSDISIDMTQAPGRLFGEDFAIVIAKETTQISD